MGAGQTLVRTQRGPHLLQPFDFRGSGLRGQLVPNVERGPDTPIGAAP